jgi:hypothetical protein
MKPNDQQIQWLREYLRAVLKYRETYEEVYDHILAALDKKQEQSFFETVVSEIINEDFGGNNGLMQLEENCKRRAVREVGRQYRRFFCKWFTFATVIYISGAFLLFYFFDAHIIHALRFPLLLLILFAPALLLAFRGYKTGYRFENTKASVRDDMFKKLFYMPLYYFVIVNILLPTLVFYIRHKMYHHPNLRFDFYLTYALSSISMLALAIHVIVFFRILKSEFKVSITK